VHLGLRVIRQRFYAFAAPENFQEVRWRCVGGEQILQLRQKIAVREPAGFE
jgi:hypothetical protein